MRKSVPDTNVKKTLVRNAQQKMHGSENKFDLPSNSLTETARSYEKQNDLSKPSLCSTEVLTNYIYDVKRSLPQPVSSEDLISDKSSYNAKITKQLNFHMNDKLYKNLVELNDSIEFFKPKKERRPPSCSSSKKDLEPNIEDFFQDEVEKDVPPKVIVIKPKFKSRKNVEDGGLHKLVASFDVL